MGKIWEILSSVSDSEEGNILESVRIFCSSKGQLTAYVVALELLSAPRPRLKKDFQGQNHMYEVWS